MIDKFKEFKTGSVLWISFILLSISGLFYLGLWSVQNDSIIALAISVLFAIAILFGIVISKFEVLKSELDFTKSCASFTMGFFLYVIIGGLIKVSQGKSFLYSVFSKFSLQENFLFSTLSGDLPIFWDRFVNTFTIPVAEELFWMIGLPIGIIWTMNILSKTGRLSFLANKFLQLMVILLIAGVTFAIFHVGNAGFIAFLIGSFIFRSILILFVYGDSLLDIFPFMDVLTTFALGAHIANNIMAKGLMNWLIIMYSEIFGKFIIVFMLIILGIGLVESVDQAIPNIDIGNNG